MKASFLFFLALCATVHAADLIVSVTEVKTGAKSFFRVDPTSLQVESIPAAAGRVLPEISKYTIQDRQLTAAISPLTQADDVLAQCTVDGADFVVVRDEHNSFSSVVKVLVAISGHPIQVSKIVVIKITNGKLIARKELVRQSASYKWLTTISQ